MSNKFSRNDVVSVTFKTRLYDISNVKGVVEDVAPQDTDEMSIKVKLEQNVGHDMKGGGPKSGPYIYVSENHITLIEKYKPKKLEGVSKSDWKSGDRFMVKKGFSIANDEEPDHIGVTTDMVKIAESGKVMNVAAVCIKEGLESVIDDEDNFFWKREWIEPVE